MRWLEVNRSGPLKGRIRIPGSKNSSLALLAASCLADEPVHISNIPVISDIQAVFKLLDDIGASVTGSAGKYSIDLREYIRGNRSGPLFFIPCGILFSWRSAGKTSPGINRLPGGDNFVSRPIDQHIKGLKALGAKIGMYEDHYVVEADSLNGAEIFFDVMTCGATINTMLAAVLARGRTTLYNAAKDPEVVDTAIMLNKMGARVYGAGTDTIRIIGVDQLGGCTHSSAPDRLIAGAWLIAGAEVLTVEGVIRT